MMKKPFDLQSLVRTNVQDLKPYTSARDEYVSNGAEMIFLDANENPNTNGVNRYPDPHQRTLKSVLAEHKRVDESQLLLGNGSDEILDLIFRAFCEPNTDNIIILPPTYGMYKVLAGTNAIECREVLLDSNFQPDVQKILDCADDNSKLLFICSPNNPTGNGFTTDRIEQLLTNFSGLIVIDEAYIDFSEQQSWVDSLGSYQNLVVTQTLSKAYGMAGIRLGICYASEDIVSVLKKIKPPYNVNELTQQRALEGISGPLIIEKQIKTILKERQRLREALKTISFVKQVYQSDANFILAKVDDGDMRYGQILNKGIVVRNRSSQPLCAETLRFTIGTPTENKKLIQALKELQ